MIQEKESKNQQTQRKSEKINGHRERVRKSTVTSNSNNPTKAIQNTAQKAISFNYKQYYDIYQSKEFLSHNHFGNIQLIRQLRMLVT